MARRIASKRELLDRWRGIEEDDESYSANPTRQRDIRQKKEEWFSDTFSFLINLSKDTHIWCGYWDLMTPLLETFYNYFNNKRNDSPLEILWKRISLELGQCTQCICQYHQAQEMYSSEYDLATIGPLLNVLRTLDEERVTEHLKEINGKMAKRDLNPENNDAEVVSVMFEVLMFPTLLDDRSLVNEFQKFIEAIDNSHELTLAGHQQYPGVYALLFLKSGRARSIGHRLAGYMGKLRSASDMEPLQPLLKKYIGFLETYVLPSTLEDSRPRSELDRLTVWTGIKSLLGFLEPPTFEEGLLERYPVFLSIVLNHVSDDTPEFTFAINCLRLLFGMLGCKLWLRATFSPSVMRNTLLGQCFHTRHEKSHKEIFDIIQPFLQSLEALQDGEHEKQRRHFIYFLLHQVTQSSNFSLLMRKKARQIALLIVLRGYKMNPPSPPYECAHMWAPSLVSSLKDSSLHSSLRQPAFDLIHIILVSDASALISLKLRNCAPLSADMGMSTEYFDEDDELPFFHDMEEKESSCWNEFGIQGKLASRECNEWMCIPMLWYVALIEVDLSALPISFSKAVFWALSRFSMLEPANNTEMSVGVKDWLSSYGGDISASFGWEIPRGFDDGGDGKVSKNSVNASTKCISLIRTFKRFAAHFVIQMEHRELRKQWTWEPRMAESLTLLLLDPNDEVRQVARLILEHVSKTRGLTAGLRFLCSSASSISAIYLGLRYALKLAYLWSILEERDPRKVFRLIEVIRKVIRIHNQRRDERYPRKVLLDSISSTFHNLQHLFFIARKLLKEVASPKSEPASQVIESKLSMFSSEGGFLLQPLLDHSPGTPVELSNVVDIESWDRFCSLLSGIMWPSMLKCLEEGKQFIENKTCQMACVRLLEMLPIILERLISSASKLSVGSETPVPNVFEFKWLCDLIDWGRSSNVIISRHWKQSVLSLLDLLKGSCCVDFSIGLIEKLISSDIIAVHDLRDKVLELSALFSRETADTIDKKILKKKISAIDDFPFGGKYLVKEPYLSDDADVHVVDRWELPKGRADNKVVDLLDEESNEVDTADMAKKMFVDSKPKSIGMRISKNSFGVLQGAENNVIDLSDDDLEKFVAADKANLSYSTQQILKEKMSIDRQRKPISIDTSKDTFGVLQRSEVTANAGLSSRKLVDDISNKKPLPSKSSSVSGKPASLIHSKVQVGKKHDINSVCNAGSNSLSQKNIDNHNASTGQTVYPKSSDRSCSVGASELIADAGLDTRGSLIKELVSDPKDDPLEIAFKKTLRPPSLVKPSVSVPKRQVIQLKMPMEGRSGNIHGLDAVVKRFKPPRLDDWYKPILELDYFSVVGLSSVDRDKDVTMTNLKEVPICFSSSEHYVEIFRPLVLEEFKAQLRNSYVDLSSPDEMSCGSLCILSVERIDDFHLVRCISDERDSVAASKGCSENDLVLLSKQPLQNSTQGVHLVGKVERREKDNKCRSIIIVIRFYLQNASTRINKAKRVLIERSKWYVSRIMSITPQLREFQALSSLKDIPMLQIILNPVDCSHHQADSKRIELGNIPVPLQQTLKSSFNDSQLQAISVSIRAQGPKKAFQLSLIQGPPGTGKTRTIVGIVSGLLALCSLWRNDSSRKPFSTSRPSTPASTFPRVKISQSTAIAKAWQDAAFARQLMKDGKEDSPAPKGGSATRGRVLICAQSNAAVDELVSRISSEGLYGSDGKMFKPYLVRVGNAKTVHPSSLPFFIDTLVEQHLAEEKMNEQCDKNVLDVDSSTLRIKLEKLVENIQLYEAKRALLRDDDSKSSSDIGVPKQGNEPEMSNAAIEAKLKILYGKKKAICLELTAAQAREKKTSEEIKTLKHKLRKSILREAEIVVTTLSGSGGDIYGVCSESISGHRLGNPSEDALFDAVVIDEAAQALEPATLIPLQLLKSNGSKCIMVGDPKQLPATVLSRAASKFLYECSMFERLQRAGHPVIMLNEQYRMHPEICYFPSLHFYDNKLVNGDWMETKSAPFHDYLGPYMFFDIMDGHENHGKNSGALSLYNESEAEAAVELLRFFKRRFPSEFLGGRIGIITPYRSQLSLLRSRFNNAFGPSATVDIEFNTVDGFQGREVDILILSTVRASDPGSEAPGHQSSSIGFVADVRRMNVALTRAKLSLWIIGNARTLQRNFNWNALIKDAKERALVIPVSRPYESMFKKYSASNRRTDSRSNLDHNSGHHLKQPGKMVKEATKVAERTLIHTKYTLEEKIKHRNERQERRTGKDVSHRGSMDKDCASGLVPRQDQRASKDMKSIISHGTDSEGKGKVVETRQGGFQSSVRAGADKAICDKLRSGRALLTESPKGGADPSKHGKSANTSQRDLKISQTSTKIGNPVEEANSGDQVSALADKHKDFIRARKRQRDAVDELLSSSLIPSKKPENSSKPPSVTKPLPHTTAAVNKLPKLSKAQPTSSASEPQDRTVPHHSRNSRDDSSAGDLEEEWKLFQNTVRDGRT